MRSIFTAALFAVCLSTAHAALTLHEAVELAGQRNPDVQGLKARIEEARALAYSASSLTPAPPAAILGARRDSPLSNNRPGTREYEVELEVPFWLPGQKAAAGASARAKETAFASGSAAALLVVAGEVRDTAWAVKLQQAELASAQRRLDTALALEALVARRLAAGDVAKADLLQAQNEVLTARTDMAERELGVQRETSVYAAITSTDAVPDSLVEPLATSPDLERHPRLKAFRAAADSARSDVQLARELRRDPPSLALQNRSESTATDQAVNTLRLNLRIPFATEARNRPRIAAAEAGLTQALVALQIEQARLEASLKVATSALETTRRQLEYAKERERLTRDALRLARRGFEQGETPFVTVLVALGQAVQSDLALARAQVGADLAIARFNQAAGVLP